MSPRDRSIVSLAVLIARHQATELPAMLERALDNGATPGEIAEIVTHLAFYAGWPNVFSAMPVFRDVFHQRLPNERK